MPHKSRPKPAGFTPAAIERQTQIDIERIQAEAIRQYFTAAAVRAIRNENRKAGEFDRGAL